jgi:rod shape-determining protein MreC
MFRLSIPAREALARLVLPILVLLSLALLLLGRAEPGVEARARTALSDALAPIFSLAAAPLSAARDTAEAAAAFVSLRAENAELRAENRRLRHWYDVAMALDAENTGLKAALHWIPDPSLSYVTAHVVADSGGVYARSVLLAIGPDNPVRHGEIALDADGVVGRVTEVGARSARVLLITDMNSRIPVMLERSRAHAILTGTNGPYPRLLYLPDGLKPEEGERVVTTAEAGAFPAGLPVGTVHYGTAPVPELDPAAHLGRLEIVRIFDYGLGGILPPEAPGHTPAPHTP